MSAPSAINSIGAAPVVEVVDETLSATVTLAVSEFSFEDGRTVEKIKDVDQKTIRTKALDAHGKGSLKGQAYTLTGMIAQKVGYSIASVDNFAATILDYDPSTGTVVCMSNKRTTKNIQNVTEVDITFEHLPYVVSS